MGHIEKDAYGDGYTVYGDDYSIQGRVEKDAYGDDYTVYGSDYSMRGRIESNSYGGGYATNSYGYSSPSTDFSSRDYGYKLARERPNNPVGAFCK